MPIKEVENLRRRNINEAKDLYENFKLIIEAGVIDWTWAKRREDRTKMVLSLVSFLRILKGEFVFFNPKYLAYAINFWKDLEKKHPNVKVSNMIKKIRESVKNENQNR